LGRPLEVRYATRSIKKFLRAEKYREAVAKLHGQKRWKQRIRKMLGLPARGHLGHYGSKETKKYYSGIRARMAGFRKLRFLQKRGRLPKGSMLPAHPRRLVAESDAQEVTELVGKDGLVQKVPRRRSVRDRDEPEAEELATPAGPTARMAKRAKRTHM